jgi:hypothetical protein
MKTTVDIPEKDLRDAMRLTGAKTKQRSGARLRNLAGKPVRLRFVLKDADLYAFRFTGR